MKSESRKKFEEYIRSIGFKLHSYYNKEVFSFKYDRYVIIIDMNNVTYRIVYKGKTLNGNYDINNISILNVYFKEELRRIKLKKI